MEPIENHRKSNVLRRDVSEAAVVEQESEGGELAVKGGRGDQADVNMTMTASTEVC